MDSSAEDYRYELHNYLYGTANHSLQVGEQVLFGRSCRPTSSALGQCGYDRRVCIGVLALPLFLIQEEDILENIGKKDSSLFGSNLFV